MDSIYITVQNCNIANNGVGVRLARSSACYIGQCNFSRNTHFSCMITDSLSSIILTRCLFADRPALWHLRGEQRFYGLLEQLRA